MPGAGAAAGATPVAPVFVWDPEVGDLRVFASADAAARSLAPWQEVGVIPAFDAEGRAIRFGVERRRTLILGVWPATRAVVTVAEVELETSFADDLRMALLASLVRRGVEERALLDRTLSELVALAACGTGG